MNASLILPASRSFSSPLARLLATTALTTILLAMPGKSAQAQVVIGDQPPPTQQEYQQRPVALPERGDWPYNVKLPRKTPAAVDPETLPSRRVSPKLMQAAHLMQSGLSPSQVQEAMAQPAPIMAAPELQGDKTDAPRDDTTTLPAVATGPLMASLADNGIGEAPAAVATPTEVAANNTAVLTPSAAPASDSVMPSSMAMLGETPTAPSPNLASQLDAPKPSTGGRALFGGKRVQVADATPMDAPSSSEKSVAADTGDHVLKAPNDMPSQSVTAATSSSLDTPADTARNSTPAKIAPLTSFSAPPKLLARIGDSSRGAVQRPADRPVTAESAPDAAPVEPVAPEAPRAPEPQPTPTPAAVLPAKADDTAQAALVPMPQPQTGDDDNTPPAPVVAVATPAPVATAKPPEHKTFWNRMFGSSEDHPESKPAPMPPVEPAKPLASATPKSPPVLVATTPVAVASPVVVAADAQPEPTPVPTSEPVASQAPVATHTLVAPQSTEPTPEPIKEAESAPAPLPQAEIAERPQTTAPSPEPTIEPVAPVATAAPMAKKPVAKAERRTLWGDLFGYNDEKPAVAVAASEPAAGPTADEEPYEPIPTAGFAAPTVVNEPATLSRSKSSAKINTEAALPKPEDRPLEPVAEPMPITAPPSASASSQVVMAPAPFAPLSDAEPPTRYIEVAPEQAPTYVPAASADVVPVPMIMAPAPAPVVPAFRVEAPTAPNANGLVTPRLVPIAPVGATAPAAMRGSNSTTISVPSGAPLAQVNFLPSSQNVDSVGQAQLQAIAEAMQMGPQTRLLLNAYAKASNEPESRRISLNRALMVRTKLAELGIQPSRIDVQALGEDTPSGIDGGHDRVDAILH